MKNLSIDFKSSPTLEKLQALQTDNDIVAKAKDILRKTYNHPMEVISPVSDISHRLSTITRKLKGCESEGAIVISHSITFDGDVEKTIAFNSEKRTLFARQPRRVLSYDKADFKKYFPTSSGSISVKSVSGRNSAGISQSNVTKKPSGNNSDGEEERNNDGSFAKKDRMVSTSYSESLDQLFQESLNISKTNREKRLSTLQEDPNSRPASTIQTIRTNHTNSDDYINIIHKLDSAPNEEDEGYLRVQIINSATDSDTETHGIYSPSTTIDEHYHNQNNNNLMDSQIDFIQYNSAELMMNVKKKVAKTVGRYLMGEVLGEGSYGKVKEGYCVETLRRVAIKIMKQSRLKKIPNGEQNMKREIALLKKLHHKNIVELMDVIINIDKHKTYVVFEYCATTLADLISRSPEMKLPTSQAQRYFKQIVHGLKYLHSHGIVHRDIKPGNLLLSFDDTLKISDFGVAEELPMFQGDDYLTSSSGSPAFQPPEIALGYEKFSGFKVDIWAVGVTLFHMISGKYPFDGDSIYALMDNIGKCQYTIPEEADEILSDLLVKIMEKDPVKRYNLYEISDHNWMRAQIPKSLQEVPVITFAYSQDDEANMSEEILNSPKAQISNPRFADDTTVTPYLETLYEDIPTSLRRKAVYTAKIKVEKKKLQISKRQQERQQQKQQQNEVIAEKFLQRMSPAQTHLGPDDLATDRPSSASSNRSTRSRLSFSGRKNCKVQ